MSIEGGKFLNKKYPDLTGSKPVERRVEKAKRDPERDFVPHTQDERIEAYLDRIDYIIKDERGWRRLKQKLVREFTIDIDDEDTLLKIAHGLYESEKRILREQGRGGDVERLDQGDVDVVSKYREAIHEKRDIQERTLSSWLEYLKQNDAGYPTWFRYFVIRNLEKMGTLNKEKGEYSKRNEYTVAPFPELNSEALGFVYRMLTTGIGHQEFISTEQDPPERRKEMEEKRSLLTTLIEKKDFIKLYTFAQIETAGALNRESIEGEWVKYGQGSDHHILEHALRGKGTGWCTAEGSAYAHLEGGDFYVYFTRGTHGTYSEPRIAIRMEGDTVAEVRGVNHRQELEPALVEVAQKQYQTLPGGDQFDKKSADMKWVTALVAKQEKGQPFTREDLRFLYELDAPIEGFGYERDPRIEELRNQRNQAEDLPTIFECSKEQIAYDIKDVTSDTKAYIGPWNPDVYQIIKQYPQITHHYESFPEKEIFMMSLETDPAINTPEKAEAALEAKKIDLVLGGKNILRKTPFSIRQQTYPLVEFSVAQLGLSRGATTDEIYRKAQSLGFDLCPAEVGPHLRLQYAGTSWKAIAMKQITGPVGSPVVFSLVADEGKIELCASDAMPGLKHDNEDQFVFLSRKLES